MCSGIEVKSHLFGWYFVCRSVFYLGEDHSLQLGIENLSSTKMDDCGSGGHTSRLCSLDMHIDLYIV